MVFAALRYDRSRLAVASRVDVFTILAESLYVAVGMMHLHRRMEICSWRVSPYGELSVCTRLMS